MRTGSQPAGAVTSVRAADALPRMRRSSVMVGDRAASAAIWDGERARAAGPPVVLVHGLGASSIHWELVGGGLAAAMRRRVVALDLLGFGRSRGGSADATVTAQTRFLGRYLAEHGPAVLVGHSMGGAIAVRVAAGCAESLAQLVLVGPALPQLELPFMPQPALWRMWLAALPFLGAELVRLYGLMVSPERILDERMTAALHRPERLDPEVLARMVALARLRREFPEAPACYAAAARSVFAYVVSPAGLALDARAVRSPTLVVHGPHDRLVPLAFAEAIVRRQPTWELAVLHECGHVPQLEAPGEFIDVLTAWTERRAGEGV